MAENELVELDDVEVVQDENGKQAFQIKDARGRTHWLPRSQARVKSDGKTVEIALWLAEDKGLV